MAASEKLDILSRYAIERTVVKPGREVFVIKHEDVKKVFVDLINRFGYEGFYLSTIIGTDLQAEGKIRLDYYIVLLPEELTVVIRTFLDRQNPVIDSLVDLLPGAVSGECETHDLLGVVFRGNPFIRRGFFSPRDVADRGAYPLRKDSGV